MNKMTKYDLAARTTVALALAVAGWSAHAQRLKSAEDREAAKPAAAEPAASTAAPANAARPQVVTVLQAAQAMVQQGQGAEAQAKLRELDAVGPLSPYETYHVERTRAFAALKANDTAQTIRSLDAALATGQATPDDRQRLLLALADLHFRQKDYPKAIGAAQGYFKEGGQDPQIRTLMTNALYLQGDFAAAAKELSAEVQADEAAGRAPSEQRLRMLASAQAKVNDDAGYAQTIERLALRYPKAELWADLINRAQSEPGYSDHLRLDAYRLKMAAGTMKQAGEYAEMAQLALQAGFPAEAQKVLEEGTSRGLLGTGGQAQRHQQLRDQARKAAAADAATLQASAQTAKDGNAMVGIGWALVTSGQADKGIALIEQGIAKGGLKRPDDARLRLGVAQYMAGRKDAAAQTMKAVQGKDGTGALARVWSLLLQAPPATTAQAPVAATAPNAKP